MPAPPARSNLGRSATAGRFMLPVLRLLCALLGAVALGWQLAIHIGMGFSVANFFSYFTNLSNLFAAAAPRIFTLHYVMPCAIILEWLVAPPAMKFGARQLLPVLVFPSLYLIYTLIRGRMLGWYPYPFLNPASVGGSGVAVHAVGIAVTFIFAGWILLAAANRLGVAAAAVRNAGVS
jgi:hypothetical protein